MSNSSIRYPTAPISDLESTEVVTLSNSLIIDQPDSTRKTTLASILSSLGIMRCISFSKGGVLENQKDIAFYEEDGTFYTWNGPYPKIVEAGSTPKESGGVGSNAWINNKNTPLVRVWKYHAIADGETTIQLPKDIPIVDVQAIYVQGLRQDLNEGFTYNAADSTIILADGLDAGDLVTVIIGIDPDSNKDIFAALKGTDGASNVGTSSGDSVQDVLDNLLLKNQQLTDKLASNNGASNIGTLDGITVEDALSNNAANIREHWCRQLSDAGLNLVDGSFEEGAIVSTSTDAIWCMAEGQCYTWDGNLPKIVPAGSTSDSTGGVKLGAWVSVGNASLRSDIAKFDYKDKLFEDSLLKRAYIFESVSEMIAADFTGIKDGAVVKTLKNEFGLICESTWRISSSQLETTYNVTISDGRYAQLALEPEMSFAAFGFGGTDIQNAAAVAEGNRVARANALVHTLRFPAGAYSIAYFTLDVDRRGFTWDGAGWDATYLVSTSDNISMLHVQLDPRNRAKDRDHFYQTVKGFTIDGDITNKGTKAAQRTVCAAHYSRIGYKSVGHRVSNVDICALEVRWFGHTQGRTNGGIATANSLRVRYNSAKLDGYIGGASQSTVNTAIHGPYATLSSTASVGASSITVSSVKELAVHDIIEITGGTMEAKVITAISGSTLTLDSALSYEHTSGGSVRVPVYGTSVTGTLEVGQIQIGNAAATSISGIYSEESRIYVYGFANGLEIHGNNIDESAPAITIDSTVDRNSVIRIVCNETAFPIEVNVKERATGAVNANLDLYNFPELDIQQNTRAQQSILVNGIYAFKSLKVERFYDTTLNDRAFTSFKFTGFSATQNPASATEILRFAQDVALRGYDGHSYNISATIRRSTGLSGLIERKGQTSIIGDVISDTTAAASRTLNNYAFFNASDGMDLLIGSNTRRMGIVLKGEPSGGQTIKAMISGEIISII